ncbi:MAG: cyanophycinase [Bryobacteraceae bacterium]
MRALFLLAPLLAAAQTGSLVVVGGGEMPPVIPDTFLELAGGRDARIVVVPTAGEEDQYEPKYLESTPLHKAGARNLVLLHTRDPKLADTEAFAAPLRQARGVWFGGGRQWRLADAYLGTRTEREFHAVLARGGVIGGTSAGATIQGSYLVRGAPEGNHIMMAPGHERGFGFLPGVAIDQHLLKRNRERDLVAVVERHPELLGIGIDEGTAIVVHGTRFRVIGASRAAIYENGKTYYFLSPGDSFDLKARRRVDD